MVLLMWVMCVGWLGLVLIMVWLWYVVMCCGVIWSSCWKWFVRICWWLLWVCLGLWVVRIGWRWCCWCSKLVLCWGSFVLWCWKVVVICLLFCRLGMCRWFWVIFWKLFILWLMVRCVFWWCCLSNGCWVCCRWYWLYVSRVMRWCGWLFVVFIWVCMCWRWIIGVGFGILIGYWLILNLIVSVVLVVCNFLLWLVSCFWIILCRLLCVIVGSFRSWVWCVD